MYSTLGNLFTVVNVQSFMSVFRPGVVSIFVVGKKVKKRWQEAVFIKVDFVPPVVLINGNREMGRRQIQIREWLGYANGLPSLTIFDHLFKIFKFDCIGLKCIPIKPPSALQSSIKRSILSWLRKSNWKVSFITNGKHKRSVPWNTK